MTCSGEFSAVFASASKRHLAGQKRTGTDFDQTRRIDSAADVSAHQLHTSLFSKGHAYTCFPFAQRNP